MTDKAMHNRIIRLVPVGDQPRPRDLPSSACAVICIILLPCVPCPLELLIHVGDDICAQRVVDLSSLLLVWPALLSIPLVILVINTKQVQTGSTKVLLTVYKLCKAR